MILSKRRVRAAKIHCPSVGSEHQLILFCPLGNESEIKRLVQGELPALNRQVLEVLLLFLSMVAAHAATTRVTQHELAIIFAPLVLRPRVETIESMMENNQRCSVFSTLLGCADKLFSKGPTKRSIVKKRDTPEIFQQRQKLNQIKSTVKDAIASLSAQLAELSSTLEKVDTMPEIMAVTQTLKSIKDSLSKYHESNPTKVPATPAPESICTTLVESGHTSVQGRRPTMEDEARLPPLFDCCFPYLFIACLPPSLPDCSNG